MPKGYIIGHVRVTNPGAYSECVQRDTPIFERYGATFVVRGGRGEVKEGEAGDRHMVMEFPTYEAAMAAYNDRDYQAIVGIRRANSEGVLIVAEGT